MASDVLDGDIVNERPRLSRRIADQAKSAPSGAILLDLIYAPFYAIGWVTFWMFVVLGGTTRNITASVKLGFLDARTQAQERQIAADRWPVRPKRPKPGSTGGPR